MRQEPNYTYSLAESPWIDKLIEYHVKLMNYVMKMQQGSSYAYSLAESLWICDYHTHSGEDTHYKRPRLCSEEYEITFEEQESEQYSNIDYSSESYDGAISQSVLQPDDIKEDEANLEETKKWIHKDELQNFVFNKMLNTLDILENLTDKKKKKPKVFAKIFKVDNKKRNSKQLMKKQINQNLLKTGKIKHQKDCICLENLLLITSVTLPKLV